MASEVDFLSGRGEGHSKRCTVCGGAIPWKRWLDRSWHELKYCGAACRRKAVAMNRAATSTLSVFEPGQTSAGVNES